MLFFADMWSDHVGVYEWLLQGSVYVVLVRVSCVPHTFAAALWDRQFRVMCRQRLREEIRVK